jgi:hypothetical protein
MKWRRLIQFEEKTSPFHYPDTLWAFADGILIFPSAEAGSYTLYDISAGTMLDIDLESVKKDH